MQGWHLQQGLCHVPTTVLPPVPPQGQEKLSCIPRKENGSRVVLCELGNPMKAGAQVWAVGHPLPPTATRCPPLPPAVTHCHPPCPSDHCGHGAERDWAGGRGRCHHLPAPAQEVTVPMLSVSPDVRGGEGGGGSVTLPALTPPCPCSKNSPTSAVVTVVVPVEAQAAMELRG